MGFFDFFGKSKQDSAPLSKGEKEVARLARLVGNKLAQNYDRQEAIEILSKMGTRDSAAALLRRFDWTLDPSITDQEEKEAAVRGIVAAGEDALEPIRQYCKKAEGVTWPLRIIKEIVPAERIVEEILGILDQFDTEYVRNSEPKVQLLQTLEEYASEDVRIAVEPFLSDANEPVRFVAVGTVFSVNDATSAPALVAALEEEESLRVKNRIAQGLSERGWPLEGALEETCKKALPEGFRLNAHRVVAA